MAAVEVLSMTDEYYLSRKEFTAIGEFMKKHEHANIFALRYSGESGIGINTHVICCECQAEEDVTDYDDW